MIADRIDAAELHAEPWPHLEIAGFLDGADEIAARWPTAGWDWLRHSDVTRPDGTSLRRYQPLDVAFPDVAHSLRAPEVEAAFRRKLGVTGDLHPQLLLIEDAPGYKIRAHTDCAGKVITCQVYLAEDGEHASQGAVLQDRLGSKVKQVPYAFNRAYAFKVTGGSWHRVRPAETRRRSIQLLYYSMPNPRI